MKSIQLTKEQRDKLLEMCNALFPEKRGKGAGHKNHELRVERATFLGFDYIICTVKGDNAAELSILKKHGFKELDEFKNTNTGNINKIFGKILTR